MRGELFCLLSPDSCLLRFLMKKNSGVRSQESECVVNYSVSSLLTPVS
jgi:hypothetical protein